MTAPTNRKNLLTHGGDPVPDTDSDSISITIAILADLLAFFIQSPADFYRAML